MFRVISSSFQIFRSKFCVNLSTQLCVLHVPAHLILLNFITQVMFDEASHVMTLLIMQFPSVSFGMNYGVSWIPKCDA